MLESTRRVSQQLGTCEQIDRFMLVGGTALSLLEKHRLSEDLDFAIPALRLPARTVESMLDQLVAGGATIEQVVNVAAQQEFENDGLDVNDYQRDYTIDGVKVTFFAPGAAESAILKAAVPVVFDGLRVADAETIFRLKAVLLTERVTSRDLFDLYYFAEIKGKGMEAILDVVRQYHPTYPYESLKHRLTRTPMRPDDPGFEPLISDAIDLASIRDWFQRELDEWEVREAERLATEIELHPAPGPSPLD